MNAIRIVITLFVLALIVISALGWRWTAAHQSASQSAASHVVLMGLLPALAEADIAAFGGALSAIQTITGRWFASVQGGTFAPGPGADLVRQMTEWGAAGVGQSSWGPTVYGIVDGERAGAALADRVRATMGTRGAVYEGPFRSRGACVSTTPR